MNKSYPSHRSDPEFCATQGEKEKKEVVKLKIQNNTWWFFISVQVLVNRRYMY